MIFLKIVKSEFIFLYVKPIELIDIFNKSM